MKSDSENFAFLEEIASNCEIKGHLDRATKIYEKICELDPTIRRYTILAKLYNRMGNQLKALRVLNNFMLEKEDFDLNKQIFLEHLFYTYERKIEDIRCKKLNQ